MYKGLSEFQIGKIMGKWAENLLKEYFKTNCQKIGFNIFEYGSKVITKERNRTQAPDRPDFIVLPMGFITSINIDLDSIDLTTLLDNDKLLQNIVNNAHCFIEMRSSMRYFNLDKYKKEALNFILEQKRIERLHIWKKRVKTERPIFITWALLDKIFIVSLDKLQKLGRIATRTYERIGMEAKKVETYNLPFKQGRLFADIEGTKIIPQIAITVGGDLRPYVMLQGGLLKNVALEIIRDLITD